MRTQTLIVFAFSFLASALTLKGQEKLSFKEVDSLSLAYFQEGKWEELEKLGEQAEQAGIEYFYLNLRLGVAKYRLHKYYEADKYYKKAQKSNPNNEWVKENIFWNYIWMEDYWMADGAYNDFTDEEKAVLLYNTKDLLAFGYAEVGIKISDLPDSAGNMSYAALGGYHKFSPSIALYHQVSFLSQETYDGSFNQYEYHLSPNFRLSKSVRFLTRFNFIHNQFEFDFKPSFSSFSSEQVGMERIDTDFMTNSDYIGTVTAQTFYGQVGVNWTHGRWKVSPSVGIFSDQIKRDYRVESDTVIVTLIQPDAPPDPMPPIPSRTVTTTSDTTVFVRTTNESTQIQLSTGISYTLPIMSDRIRLGADLYYIDGDESDVVVSPNIHFKANKKLSFRMSYLNIGEYFFSEIGGTTVYNASTFERQKISITGSYKLKNNWKLYLTLQNEQIEDKLRSLDYQTNNLFLGLKF